MTAAYTAAGLVIPAGANATAFGFLTRRRWSGLP